MLERLRIVDLRCLQEVELTLHPQVNWIVGPNASGKTSVLEAVHLLSLGRSFRTRHTAELIRRGASRCVCSALLSGSDRRGRPRRIGIEVQRSIRRVRMDGRPVRSSRELTRALRVRIVDPHSHRLVTGAPAHRRALIDWVVFHVEHEFAASWATYRHALEQRNASLRRGGSSMTALPSWERVMADAGERVAALREALVGPFTLLLQEELRELLPECAIQLSYRRGWAQDSSLAEMLERSRTGDARVGYTRYGPHRADLGLETSLGPASRMLSQGQQKLLALALVVAQFRLVHEREGASGVLLVDDLAAELDPIRWEKALERLRALRVQLLVTSLEKGDRSVRSQGERWFHVEQGTVCPRDRSV